MKGLGVGMLGKRMETFWKRFSKANFLYLTMATQRHWQLLQSAFKKASAHLQEHSDTRVSKTQCAEEIATFITEDFGFSINERTLRNYWNSLEKNPEQNPIQSEVLEGLSRYLGYHSYSNWIIANDMRVPTAALPNNRKLYWIAGICVVLIVVLVSFYYATKQRWMAWKEDHYEETDFDSKLLQTGVLKPYDASLLESFKKVHKDSIAQFFSADGSPLIWYGKNPEGEYEYFTDLDRHPETGKSLKEITQYIIEHHIENRK
ncbi:MAG: hypothetical protein CL596_02140 [Alteromonas sp.]|nr:hypothetical protein [Alteromonas sp.]MAY22493.1 hypothetical protein [Flavobacteriaceae bacterium]|tara:strand:+ start:104 stop:886 length:783 start_codon:yes stop_codon:yes gene_type:complete